MKWLILCSVMAMAAYSMTEEVKDAAEEVKEGEPVYKPGGGKFLVGVLRTNVVSIGSTTTISVAAVTCQNGVATTTCSGRKKRMALPELPDVQPGNFKEDLGSSLKEDNSSPSDSQSENPDLQKLVIWRTSTTTLTFTSSSTVSGTTLSLSYYCTA